MGDVYVSQILLEINGQQVDDFSKLTEKAVEYRATVQLMNKFGFVTKPHFYGISVDYVIPSDAPEFDFTQVANGTLTVDEENGVRITYSNVYLLSEGDVTREPGKEATKTIELAALKRTRQ